MRHHLLVVLPVYGLANPCRTDSGEAMTEGISPMRERVLDPAPPDRPVGPAATVHGWGYFRLPSCRPSGNYAPVTKELMERVLQGLRGLNE
jgi:hypothetical protein